MTALAGVWHFNGKPDAESRCHRVLRAQQIYGPHGQRGWSDGSIALGRQLYRTVPEDAYDRQPLHSRDGRLTLVADLRLDNREDLSAKLVLHGEAASGICDAALLLEALDQWGEGALDHLVGDFAIALWDSRTRTMLLARDFLGQRPLHYHRGKDFFAFATMPKGLHALPEIPYAPDHQAIGEFLTLMPEDGSRSYFKDICTVAPGHFVRVTPDRIEARRYWEPCRTGLALPSTENFVEGLRHHLNLATRARLRGANGTVGTHLSGGFDSAAVTSTAARLLAPEGGKVVAFTSVPRQGYAAPRGTAYMADEGPLAAATAAMYDNIEHVLISAGHISPLEAIDRDFFIYERPTLNRCNATWWSAIASQARERGLSVMLTGQMGNMTISYAGLELMSELFRSGRMLALWRLGRALISRGRLPWHRTAASTLGPYLPGWLWRAATRLAGRNRGLLTYSAIHPDCLAALDLAVVAKERGLDLDYQPRRDGFETRLWVLGRVDLGNYNKGMLAGWGVDQRDPTADKRLVEYCLGVPMNQYLAAGETRALGRRALSDRLPQAVLNESRKGYQAADWHESLTAARGEIRAELNRLAQCKLAAAALDMARLRSLVDTWPEAGWERDPVASSYRSALLRGISAGHFLRRTSGSNH
jgi:asparagine synthase (glutamine-hydrolysing)